MQANRAMGHSTAASRHKMDGMLVYQIKRNLKANNNEEVPVTNQKQCLQCKSFIIFQFWNQYWF